MDVLLIDNDEIVWDGTRRLIERVVGDVKPGAPVEFEAAQDVALAQSLPAFGFDLVLVAYHLPGLATLAAVEVRLLPSATAESPLTLRETEVPWLTAKGLEFGTISNLLEISTHTVIAHVKKIYRKLSVHSRGEAVYEALQMGWL